MWLIEVENMASKLQCKIKLMTASVRNGNYRKVIFFYKSAPPHAYKLSIFFWSTILAYSSKNSFVRSSLVNPAWIFIQRKKALTKYKRTSEAW